MFSKIAFYILALVALLASAVVVEPGKRGKFPLKSAITCARY